VRGTVVTPNNTEAPRVQTTGHGTRHTRSPPPNTPLGDGAAESMANPWALVVRDLPLAPACRFMRDATATESMLNGPSVWPTAGCDGLDTGRRWSRSVDVAPPVTPRPSVVVGEIPPGAGACGYEEEESSVLCEERVEPPVVTAKGAVAADRKCAPTPGGARGL